MIGKVISDVWAGVGLLTWGGWVPPSVPNPAMPLVSHRNHPGCSVLDANMPHFFAATDSHHYGRCTSYVCA
jgi:hypothetical protein